MPPFSTEVDRDAVWTIQYDRPPVWGMVFLTADLTRPGKRICLEHDHSLIAVNVTMFGSMFQTKIGGDRQLKDATVVVVYSMAFTRSVFMLTV